mmetsp:Transcript_32468/g.74620  ORF Transcript_32468/g.74620 Transcript_32468/m.74620 type:complete len:415 (-) Transcript_32468:93-1337(-)
MDAPTSEGGASPSRMRTPLPSLCPTPTEHLRKGRISNVLGSDPCTDSSNPVGWVPPRDFSVPRDSTSSCSVLLGGRLTTEMLVCPTVVFSFPFPVFLLFFSRCSAISLLTTIFSPFQTSFSLGKTSLTDRHRGSTKTITAIIRNGTSGMDVGSFADTKSVNANTDTIKVTRRATDTDAASLNKPGSRRDLYACQTVANRVTKVIPMHASAKDAARSPRHSYRPIVSSSFSTRRRLLGKTTIPTICAITWGKVIPIMYIHNHLTPNDFLTFAMVTAELVRPMERDTLLPSVSPAPWTRRLILRLMYVMMFPLPVPCSQRMMDPMMTTIRCNLPNTTASMNWLGIKMIGEDRRQNKSDLGSNNTAPAVAMIPATWRRIRNRPCAIFMTDSFLYRTTKTSMTSCTIPAIAIEVYTTD